MYIKGKRERERWSCLAVLYYYDVVLCNNKTLESYDDGGFYVTSVF